MKKISRIAAFYEVTRAIEKGEEEKANAMFRVVTDSIANDKANDTFSEYIILKNKKQENLFKNIILDNSEQEN